MIVKQNYIKQSLSKTFVKVVAVEFLRLGLFSFFKSFVFFRCCHAEITGEMAAMLQRATILTKVCRSEEGKKSFLCLATCHSKLVGKRGQKVSTIFPFVKHEVPTAAKPRKTTTMHSLFCTFSCHGISSMSHITHKRKQPEIFVCVSPATHSLFSN